MPLIFDVYGTLLDVDAAARIAAKDNPMLKQNWPQLAAGWRQRQLSYSWLRSLMGRYIPFWQITTDALEVTLEEMGIDDTDLKQNLLNLYYQLSAYDEVPQQLQAMHRDGHQIGVLSNGSPDMLTAGLKSAEIDGLIGEVLSVDSLGIYKPDPRVYAMVLEAYGCQAEEVFFFSSNNWDVAGAGSFGFKTIWVNRANKTWDDLPERPHHVVSSLAEALSIIS
jgi:2-haloacid dehalogenase